MAMMPASEMTGNRKVLHNVVHVFYDLKSEYSKLEIEDLGFTKNKLNLLRKLYLVEESRDAMVNLWKSRCEKQDSYGSVAFTCHGHTSKADPESGRPGALVSPCIQSISLTLHENKTVTAHAFYRVAEAFKKFPADLIFIRDILLPPFEKQPDRLVCLFANVTLHPMFFATIIPYLPDPIAVFQRLEDQDSKFWRWCVRCTARYILPENRGNIEKFSQAFATFKAIDNLLEDDMKAELTDYIVEEMVTMDERYDNHGKRYT